MCACVGHREEEEEEETQMRKERRLPGSVEGRASGWLRWAVGCRAQSMLFAWGWGL